MSHNAIGQGKTTVITGGATGIGMAAANRCAEQGMRIVVADVRNEMFENASTTLLASGAHEVLTYRTDVADASAVKSLEAELTDRFSGIDVLICNAGIQPGSDIFNQAVKTNLS